MNKEEFISSGLLEQYAVGISSPEETRLVKEHLESYPELREELKALEMSLENYALSSAVPPSSSVKEKLMNQIFPESEINQGSTAPVVPITKKIFIPFFYKSIAAAVFILLIGSVILNYVYYNKYHSVQQNLAVANQKIDQQQAANLAMSRDLDIVTNKYTRAVVLNGTAKAPDALAKIFWIKNTGQVYIDPSNLPKAPAGKQYQLWGIVDGKPVSGGMIKTSNGIYHIQKMKSFGKVDAFAITLEKAGGSPTPTLDEMIVSAKM